MFRTPSSKRVRAIVIALVITFGANLAISFAADASKSAGNLTDRSGVLTPPPLNGPPLTRPK